MFTKGEYRRKDGTYGVIVENTKTQTEIILVTSGQVSSAFKIDKTGEYSFCSTKAKELWALLSVGLKGCTAKNGNAVPFVLGTATRHEFVKAKTTYTIDRYNSEMAGAEITKDAEYVYLEPYTGANLIPQNIPYIKLTQSRAELNVVSDEDDVIVRSVEEIALSKESVAWIKGKKYYIVNDDATAEKLFAFLDSYQGPIAYDTETSGLRINMFGKINSKEQKELMEYNLEHPEDTIRADRLVGIIFCVEKDVSYYFPVGNRKFKNLYDDIDSDVRKATIKYIRANKAKADPYSTTDMGKYLRDTADDDISSDVILMERVRFILENQHIVAHNGAFEWKVGQLYDIDTNLKDDTIILHQLMYKFRSTTSNRGEPSNLKYLAKVELGIDQWELGDYFPDFKDDKRGEVRGGKNAKKRIDFSYMTYEGTRIYAPTDGDVTLQLYMKYKKDLLINHKNMEYLYNVEVIVACAVAYMEFYGHRLDEKKIASIREHTRAEIVMIESQIRQLVGYSKADEIEAYNELKDLVDSSKEQDKKATEEEIKQAADLVAEAITQLQKRIKENEDNVLNLGSPTQVGELFYDVLEIPVPGEKRSVAKKEIKSLVEATNADESPRYPVVKLYSDYKKQSTLMTKFFDNLPYFMYPGGFIFSSFGQISTATGRMSCSKPNAQQYPKAVTGIVIPRFGCVMADADFSQIEYRVLVAMAGEKFLADLFADPDNDYHTLMASLMYGVPYASVTPKMRGDAKSFNFGIPYGMGIKSLARLLFKVSDPTRSQIEEAQEKYELYFKDQPNVRKFFDQVKEMAKVNSYTKTFWNRYRHYSFTDKDGKESSGKKAAALRQAGNAVIQGCLGEDTRIQTKDFGIVKIKDIVGKHLLVWAGDKWTNGDITYSGLKQKCIVNFSTGQSMICSPIHKFLVKSAKGNERFVECQSLRGSVESNNPHLVVRDRHYAEELGDTVAVESVEITDEYIEMYDVCNTDKGYYVADGVITHNTAADIFKISVARNFMYIRQNKLIGSLYIINMIHDEQLFEIDSEKLRVQKVLADISENMQFKIQGFPPLFIGAGVGPSWAKAKDKMAEIHPYLMDRFVAEEANNSIFATEKKDPADILKYYEDRVYNYRVETVRNYVTNEENFNKDVHPAVGNLLNLQFSYGHNKDKEGLSDEEYTKTCLSEFLIHNNVNIDPNVFKATASMVDAETDDGYEDEDEDEFDEDGIGYGEDALQTEFKLVDESNKMYGVSLQDIISQFGYVVSVGHKACGIDMRVIGYKQKDAVVEFLTDHICDKDDPDALEIIFLQDAGILFRSGQWVKGIEGSKLAAKLRLEYGI